MENYFRKKVSKFEIQKRITNGTYKTIVVVSAKGDASTYKFIDTDSFSKEPINDNIQSQYVIFYRVKIVYNNNLPDTYADEIAVTSNLSIKRTLGMLKEMFK